MRTVLLASTALAATTIAYMSEIVDTVTIKGENGPVRINASEFDPKKHKLAAEDKDEVPITQTNTFVAPVEPPVPASAPIMNDGNMHLGAHRANTDTTHPNPDGDRPVALDPPQPPAEASNTVQRQVAKFGSKYFVVDSTGEKIEADGIDKDGYKKEEDAWKAALPQVGETVTQ